MYALVMYMHRKYCARAINKHIAEVSNQLGSICLTETCVVLKNCLGHCTHTSIAAYVCTFTICDSGVVKSPGSCVLPLRMKYSIKQSVATFKFIGSSYATTP